MTALISLWKLPGQILEAAGSVAGVRTGTEEPHYTVVDRLGAVEIRRYGPRVAAETVVDADEDEARAIGFRRLARYIFGSNRSSTSIAMTAPVAQDERRQSGERIAMTAPVAQSDEGGGSVIRFYMPSKYTLDTLPEPENDRVVLVPIPSETVAVLRYTGDRSPAAVRQQREALLRTLAGSTYRTVGEPFSWFYDPPFTLPFRRRNEVGIRVTS
ncbi:SOUL family heme-binding protein [Mycobacterium sp. WMMD1722]|uniref:SOUL family heme-binding protein n=1 Tax=Mycobacterium sp. WMMD1722 TaxID=3404117 RepID=UPI003BF4A2F1